MIEVIANDRLGRKGSSLPSFLPSFLEQAQAQAHPLLLSFLFLSPTPVRVKCSPQDTVGDLKKLIAAQTGTNSKKVQLKKWCVVSSRFLVQLVRVSACNSRREG